MAIRVLIVDDSALVRKLLREILESDPEIEVVGHAHDPYVARQKIKTLDPDVLTLDIEMPRMNGLQFLRNLMRLRPMPVVMVSSLTSKGATQTLEALELGAVDYVCKPGADLARRLPDYTEEIVGKVRMAAQARVRPVEESRPSELRRHARRIGEAAIEAGAAGEQRLDLIAVGASAGGTEAIREFLAGLPENAPPVLIVQHIPREFSAAFAERLDRSCALTVREAEDGVEVEAGHAYVAPGGTQLWVVGSRSKPLCRVDPDAERVNQHKPSVDVLFRSVADCLGPRAAGVLLTGMGSDGARGLQALHEAGGVTFAQDEETSVIWGMPREAILLDAVDHVLPLNDIPGYLQALIDGEALAHG